MPHPFGNYAAGQENAGNLTVREFLFYLRWNWHYRTWQPTRQKEKAYRRDLKLYRETGQKPW